MKKSKPLIRVGIGGWTFEPWRKSFYPEGLPHHQELRFASERLSAIEVNGTYYSSFKPPTFRKWHDETPADFMFTLKATRYATSRRQLAAAGESITRFVESGIQELGSKLGPILWQLPPTKAFDADDLEAFFDLLPRQLGSLKLRHVLDVRHESFAVPEYVALARRHDIATVFTDSDKFPSIADVTGGLVYARLMGAQPRLKAGYAPKALDRWAAAARDWSQGRMPEGLQPITSPGKAKPKAAAKACDVFVFFINGAKEKAPAAAGALLDRLASDAA